MIFHCFDWVLSDGFGQYNMALDVFLQQSYILKGNLKTSCGGKFQASADFHSWPANELVG